MNACRNKLLQDWSICAAEHLIIDSALQHTAQFMPDKLSLRADEIKLWLTPFAKQITV